MNLIDKDTLIAKIEKRRNENQNVCTPESSGAYYEDGFILDTINSINIIKVEEVDLEKVFNDEYSKFSNDPDAMDYAFPIDLADYKDFAKHFFELGISINHPITASDKGMAEEIILNLEKIEKDYNLCLIKEKEWVNKQVQKGE